MNLGIKLLVAEDDPNLGTILKAYLTQKGYTVFLATDGQAAIDSYQRDEVDACILDIMMPVKDGFTVAKEIRRVDKRIPIIFLTAKNLEADKLKGFEIGADDYVTKPFSIKQLYARMEAIWRRAAADLKPLARRLAWNDGDLQIDFARCEARKRGAPLSLTPSEWRILAALAASPRKVFSRDNLIDIAFGDDFDGYDRVIDTHVKNLRKKVETDPRNPVYVQTVHGLGYKFGGGEE